MKANIQTVELTYWQCFIIKSALESSQLMPEGMPDGYFEDEQALLVKFTELVGPDE